MSANDTQLPTNYWRQFVASGVSNIGDGMVHAAAPLLTLTLTSDERLIAGVSFSAMIPWLVLSLPAGVYIDRFDRRKLMIGANVIRALLFAMIAISAATGTMNIWTFMLILLGVGCCEVVFDMTAQAFLPQIVPPHLLEKANGRLSSLELITNTFIGLPLGAWAFVIAVGVPFGVDAASFAMAAALVASIRIPKDVGNDEQQPIARPAFIPDLKEGFAWLWHNRLIRTLAIMLGITNMTAMFGDAIFVKYAADELGVTGGAFGLLLALTAIGSILGGLLGERIAKKPWSRRIDHLFVLCIRICRNHLLFHALCLGDCNCCLTHGFGRNDMECRYGVAAATRDTDRIIWQSKQCVPIHRNWINRNRSDYRWSNCICNQPPYAVHCRLSNLPLGVSRWRTDAIPRGA
jgi:MFS family permease